MKRLKYNLIVTCLLSCFTFISCDEGGKLDAGETATVELAGDWYVKVYDDSGTQIVDYFRVSTFNTAANTSEMWFDIPRVFEVKSKINVNLENFTFSANEASNILSEDGGTATFTNGKVLIGKGISSGGNVTDSIFTNLEYSVEPGVTYTVAGYRRTGFLEDEH